MSGAGWNMLADLIPAGGVLALLVSFAFRLGRIRREETELRKRITDFTAGERPEEEKGGAENE